MDSLISTFYDPVDLVLVYETPDGITRTKHMGVYLTVQDALEASCETAWTSVEGSNCMISAGGQYRYRIQPVTT